MGKLPVAESGHRLSVQQIFSLRGKVQAAQQIHQRGFPDVGVSYERNPYQAAAVAPLDGHLAVDFLQVFLQFGDVVADDTAVGLDFAFARSASCSGTASLPFQVCPHACQAWQHVFVLCQLHLCLGIGRLCPLDEDVQNEPRAVGDAAAECLLDVVRLRGRQFVVEDDNVDFVLRRPGCYLLQLAGTHVGTRIGGGEFLHETFHGGDAGRFGEELQLVEVLLALAHLLPLPDDRHEDGPFRLYRFFSGCFHSRFFRLSAAVVTLPSRIWPGCAAGLRCAPCLLRCSRRRVAAVSRRAAA